MFFIYDSKLLYQISAFLPEHKYVKNHLIIYDFEDIEGAWLETRRTLVNLYLITVLDLGFPLCVLNLSILAWLC